MTRNIAINKTVDRAALITFLRGNKSGVLLTTRSSGAPQMSPVVYGVDSAGRMVISTYPDRAKAINLRKRPQASFCVLSEDFDDAWAQINGTAEVLDLPGSVEPLVDYFRSISGEHPDWDEYREAMVKQGKSLIRITIDSWGPIASGGFPPSLSN